jgi:phage terminase small subunit
VTPKQALFVQEYLVDLHATKAAIRAGYSAKTAHVIGPENLDKPEIQAAVQLAMDARAARTGVTADRVVAELAKLGFSNMMDYISVPEFGDPFVDLTKLTRDQAAALTEVTVEEVTTGGRDPVTTKRVKIKVADKRAALVDLGKHLLMFKDRLEVTGADGAPLVQIYLPKNNRDAPAIEATPEE